ncbi:ribonuclease HI family protein [Elusimicrobiota bacterium]
MILNLFTDGASRGNPGHAGIGIVLQSSQNETIDDYCEYIGVSTNNVAEYKGLIKGLKIAKKHNPSGLNVYLDSELIIRQMQGKYKVKNETLKAYFEFANELISDLKNVKFKHIPREMNQIADKLANQAIDKAQK